MNSLVTKYKTTKEETQTFFEWNDLADPIIKTMGFDMWDAIQILKDEEVAKHETEGPNIVDYIEDGIFVEQIRESGLVNKLIQKIIISLSEQGYLKKSKSKDTFIPNEEELIELIDEKLSCGLINYFEK